MVEVARIVLTPLLELGLASRVGTSLLLEKILSYFTEPSPPEYRVVASYLSLDRVWIHDPEFEVRYAKTLSEGELEERLEELVLEYAEEEGADAVVVLDCSEGHVASTAYALLWLPDP